jgi:hypothetical protein
MDHGDARRLGVAYGREPHLRAVEEQLAGERVVAEHTTEDLDQGGFTGAVLSTQGMHFARVEPEAHVFEGDDSRIAFGDRLRLENRPGHSRRVLRQMGHDQKKNGSPEVNLEGAVTRAGAAIYRERAPACSGRQPPLRASLMTLSKAGNGWAPLTK